MQLSEEANVLASRHLQSLGTVEGLILAVNDNLQVALRHAHQDYSELNKYLVQVPIWIGKYSSTSHHNFWVKIFSQTKSLIERIRNHEINGYDTSFEEHDIPQTIETVTHRKWADYRSSEEEDDEDVRYLCLGSQLSSAPSGLVIPLDLETVWPKGYAILSDAARTFGFELIVEPQSLAMSGFRGMEALSEDETTAREAYAKLSVDEQRAMNTLKSLFIFMRLTPDQALAQDPKFALTASFALQFLLKTGNSIEDAKLALSLKHQDGGKSLILSRIQVLFRTDRSLASVFLTNAEKVFRAIAKRERERNNVMRDEMRSLIIETCFTTPEGMLENYYTRESRDVTKMVEEFDRNGKSRKVPKQRRVHGYRVPTLSLGEDLLSPAERAKLKEFEHRFSMPRLAKIAKKRFYNRGGNPEDLTTEISRLVQHSYVVASRVSTVIKQRKRQVRAEALSGGASTGKLTPNQWLASANSVMAKAQELPETTYAEIEAFLREWENEG